MAFIEMDFASGGGTNPTIQSFYKIANTTNSAKREKTMSTNLTGIEVGNYIMVLVRMFTGSTASKGVVGFDDNVSNIEITGGEIIESFGSVTHLISVNSSSITVKSDGSVGDSGSYTSRQEVLLYKYE